MAGRRPKANSNELDSRVITVNESYDEVIKMYLSALRIDSLEDKNKILDLLETLYDAMYLQYEYFNKFLDRWEKEQALCKAICEDVLPKIETTMQTLDDSTDEQIVSRWWTIYEKFYALAARNSFRHYILFLEWDKTKKTWEKRVDTLGAIIYYLNKMKYSNTLKLIRVSLPPGYGKSYMTTMWEAWCYGNDWNETIIRLSYSDTLVASFSNTLRNILKSERHRMVFPQFERMKDKLFEKETDEDWKLMGAELTNHTAQPRNGQITGKRGNIVVIDDIVKDSKEASSIALHEEIWTKYTTDWSSRALDGDQKTVAIGTMWSPYDLLNRIEEFESKFHDIVDDPIFPYTTISTDGSCVFISVPALDPDTDESTMPLVYGTQYFHKQREANDDYYWACVYQQHPIPLEGLEFDWNSLRKYTTIPRDDITGESLLNKVCYASLDPARKGKDNVSMPIFNRIGDDWYLLDCIFEKKPMSDLYDDIVNAIIKYNICYLVLENNTDTSLGFLINKMLKEKGFYNCTIKEHYSTANKEARIRDQRGVIKKRIMFPDKDKINRKSSLGRFMENVTTYCFDYPNKNDDANDSLALFTEEYVTENINTVGTIEAILRSF